MSTILRRNDFLKPGWAEALSDTWGATSLHAAVFRRPRGFQWVHCNKCRSRSSPSGMRSMVVPARCPVEMEVVCLMRQAQLRDEAEQAVAVLQGGTAPRPAEWEPKLNSARLTHTTLLTHTTTEYPCEFVYE